MEHWTTLKALREKEACDDRYKHLARALGPDWGDDKPIPLIRILDLNGLNDALWALRADLHPNADREVRLLLCDYAEHVLWAFEEKYPDDPRPRECIEVARRYAVGEASGGALAAAWDAAWAADADAAADAAGDAAARAAVARAAAAAAAWAAAAGDAAWAAGAAGVVARVVARVAAGVAEKKWQEQKFRERFGNYDEKV